MDLASPAAIASSVIAESPRSTRSLRHQRMGPPASPSTRSIASSTGSYSSADMDASSPSKKDKSGGFALPRTPSLCVRRASFKFLSNSLGKKF